MSYESPGLNTGSSRGERIFFLLRYLWREDAFSSSPTLRKSGFQSLSCRHDRVERRFGHVNHSFADSFLHIPESFLILLPLLLVPSSHRTRRGRAMRPPSCVAFLVWTWLRTHASARGLVLQCGPSLLLHQGRPVWRVVVTHGWGMVPPSRGACTDKEPQDAGWGAKEVGMTHCVGGERIRCVECE